MYMCKRIGRSIDLTYTEKFVGICGHIFLFRGSLGVMVIVWGNEYGDSSSNLGQGFFSFQIEKGMNPTILLPAIGKL